MRSTALAPVESQAGRRADRCRRGRIAGQTVPREEGHVPQGRPFPTLESRAGHTGFVTDVLPDGGDLAKVNRDSIIVRLKMAGATYRQIADVVGISKSQVQRVYREATGEQLKLDTERHKKEVFADLQLLVEALRPYVHDDEVLPNKDAVTAFVRANKAKALLLGLEGPLENTVPGNADEPAVHPAALYLANLQAWMKTNEKRGLHPHWPPEMIERVNRDELTSGTVHMGSMWSMALEFPSEDEA